MAFDDKFKIYLLDSGGQYLVANQNQDNTWSISRFTSSNPLQDQFYIKHLPKEWDNTQIDWERNTTYHGVIRSLTTDYQFTMDARAILLYLYSTRNTQAYCQMRIDVLVESDISPANIWSYETFYISDIDFGELKDNKREEILTVSTLDSKLYTLLKSNANKNYNIPFWLYTAGPDTWTPATGTEFVEHFGCKVLWSNTYTSGATATTPIYPQAIDAVGLASILDGFNHGSVSDGRHWIPAMNQYNIVQNNGTTTFLGNDLLQPLLIQQNQAFNYNRNFEGSDDIQAYSKNRGLVKNLLKNPFDTSVVDMTIKLSGHISFVETLTGTGFTSEFIGFVLFEIDNKDICAMSGGNYTYTMIYQQNIPSGGGTFPLSPFTATQNVSLKYDHSYILGIIYDDVATGISSANVHIEIVDLSVTIESTYNSGSAPVVYDAPRFPRSSFPTFRAVTAFEKLTKVIDSTGTDAYGFPTGGGTYSFQSDYLSDSSASRGADFDLRAYNLMMTSENALRRIQGQPYMTLSLQTIFDTLFRVCGVGLGIENGTGALGQDTLRVEKLRHFFDQSTLIYDLGTNVANFTIEPLTDIKADNIKAGYGAPQTNNNFGVDSFLIPQEYATQLINTPKDLDIAASAVIVDQNQIEKVRAQNSDKQQSNPSASNGVIIIDVVDDPIPSIHVIDPGGNPLSVNPYEPNVYPTAQSTDPTAATDPYIQGLYYPETAINTSLTPASNIRRLGLWLDSIAYGTQTLLFRKQYQMQYNNVTAPTGAPTALPGISKNLDGSFFCQEVADIEIPISDDTIDKLFRPDLFTVETKTPVNFYNIVNSTPYGYVQFTWINKSGIQLVYKGFIWKISQKIGNNASTTITLLAHPLTTDEDIAAA